MNIIFDYKDPIFTLFLIVSSIFIIALISYVRSLLKTKENKKSITKFLNQFNVDLEEDDLKKLLNNNVLSKKITLKIASSYYINAEYEKAIQIYILLLSLYKNSVDSGNILLLLAKTYYKVLMLDRAEATLINFFSMNPVNIEALKLLLNIYERIGEYDKALKLLEPISELGYEIIKEREYFTFLDLINSDKKDSLKVKNTLKIYKKENNLYRVIFKYLFTKDVNIAWKYLDVSKAITIIDLLWKLKKEDIDFDIVEKSSILREIFSAKGYISRANSSSYFELDILLNLRNSLGYDKADLSFYYTCGVCMYSMPLEFDRCPSCYSIDNIKVKFKLVSNKA